MHHLWRPTSANQPWCDPIDLYGVVYVWRCVSDLKFSCVCASWQMAQLQFTEASNVFRDRLPLGCYKMCWDATFIGFLKWEDYIQYMSNGSPHSAYLVSSLLSLVRFLYCLELQRRVHSLIPYAHTQCINNNNNKKVIKSVKTICT